MSPKPRSSQSHLSLHRGFLLRIALVTTVLVCAGAAVLWRLVHAEPVWYQPPIITKETEDFAGVVEYRIIEEAQTIRPADEKWKLRIREDQINAWLATRLIPWIEHEPTMYWPEGLAPPQVHLSKRGIDVGIEIVFEGSHHVVVARILPRVTEEGVAIDLQRIGAGRLLLPGDPAERVREVVEDLRNDENITSEIETFLTQMAEGGEALAREIELADDRRLRLMDLQLDEGFIDLTFRTLPRGMSGDSTNDAEPVRVDVSMMGE